MNVVALIFSQALAAAGPLHAGQAPAAPPALVHSAAAPRLELAQAQPAKSEPERQRPGGDFVDGSFRHRTETRPYKLFVPATPAGTRRPLVVMLHGCTQTPEDFAVGTHMNELAARHGFLVLYPAQTRDANLTRCWNWYKREDQGREQGEAALIAALTRDVIARHDVDPRRVYVAGVSAGAAMAAILGANHPELFAAVGIHSGVPAGAAHDLPSGMAAMRGKASASKGGTTTPGPAVPTIVFHGDQDKVVHPSNGERVADAARRGATAGGSVEEGRVPGGHAYTRTVYRDANGRVVVESWVVHGSGHAWSGGSEAGSYTDPRGPDASEAMVRFFLETR
jgi:poly(hydroxyalkanoate) depolymerase family esterase